MVSVAEKIEKGYHSAIFKLFALAKDTLPTKAIDGCDILNGSHAKEIDTGKEYLYDEENSTWEEQP